MSGNKFQVGEHVAVCSRNLRLVIPKTVVTEVEFMAKGTHLHVDGKCYGVVKFDLYVYLVQDADGWIPEQCLRSIDPDKEYLDEETQEIETVV